MKNRHQKSTIFSPLVFHHLRPHEKCPVCPADSVSNLRGITHKSGRDVPDVPGLAPKLSLGYFQGVQTTKSLHVSDVVFSYSHPALIPHHQGVDFESFFGRFRVNFESFSSRYSKSTRKRPKNGSKSTPGRGSVVVGDESAGWAVAEEQYHYFI